MTAQSFGTAGQLQDAWLRFVELLADPETRSLIGTAEAVEGLLARSGIQRQIERGMATPSVELAQTDEHYRNVAPLLLETTRISLYGNDEPITDWWWRVNELAHGAVPNTYVNVLDAARAKGAHPHTVRAAIHAGELPARQLGRTFLIHERDLHRWQPRAVGRPATNRRSDPDEVLAAFNRANTAKNFTEAGVIAKLLADNPSSGRRCLALAINAFNSTDYEGTLRWVGEANARGLDGHRRVTAAITASAALVQLHRGADAVAELEGFDVPSRLRASYTAAQVDALIEADDVDRAASVASTAISDLPFEPGPRFAAARVDFHRQKPVDALQHIVLYRQLEADDPAGLMLHGSILGALGDSLGDQDLYREALALFRLARPTEGHRAVAKIGLCAARLGHWRVALRISRRLLMEREVEGADALVRAALQAAELHEDDQTLRDAVNLAERWSPPSPWLTAYRAYILGLDDQWLAASHILDELATHSSSLPVKFQLLRAIAWAAANRLGEARQVLSSLPLDGTPWAALPDLLEVRMLVDTSDGQPELDRRAALVAAIRRLASEPSPVGILASAWRDELEKQPAAKDELSPALVMALLDGSKIERPLTTWDVNHRSVSQFTARVASSVS